MPELEHSIDWSSNMSFLSCCLDPDIFESVLKKCADPHCCCGCCLALRPRYKRLVDSIFPVNPQDGLVRNNMEKLTFYALSSPEKLDRIGEYLLQRVGRDISRHRNGFVMVAVEALDQLLVACHSQSLNLFVESFLKMVQKLLETTDSQLQLLATQSFVKFSNIEEDTPSYHRRYDFFVSKFSSLCHSNVEDASVRRKLRVAGLKGLQGVVRKTVSDDLQVNIWEKTHMDKIIPSLLFNMQDERSFPVSRDATDSRSDDNVPATLAESCLREVAGKATFGNVKAVCQPILKHFDNHHLWVPNDFAVHTLKILVFSIKSQYTPDVMQILLTHLDEHAKSKPSIRTGMVDSLARITAIAAGDAIGPSVVSTVNSLLAHLRRSADSHSQKEEKPFQDAVINALGSFVEILPDYQKIEVMMFILSKVPLPERDHSLVEGDVLIQNKLLKSLLKVATKYSTVQMATTFQSQFIQPLLRVSLAPEPDTRLVVQQILHTLIDRHNNLDKVQKPSLEVVNGGDLNTEKCSRQDVMFMKKNGQDLYMCVYNNIQFNNNRKENFDALHTTLFLLAVEVANEDVIVDLIRLTLAIQELAISSPMSDQHRCFVHAAVASLFHLFSYLTSIPSFSQYVEKIIKERKAEAPYLLPDNSNGVKDVKVQFPIKEEFLFDHNAIVEAFRTDEHDVIRLQTSFVPRQSFESSNVTRSMSDLNSISVEVDSINSSPGITRKQPEEEITVESLKKMMAEPLDAEKQADELRRIQILEYFRTAAFEELVAKSESKTDQLQFRLNEIFSRLSTGGLTGQHGMSEHSPRPPGSPITGHKVGDRLEVEWTKASGPPVYEISFPDLFVF